MHGRGSESEEHEFGTEHAQSHDGHANGRHLWVDHECPLLTVSPAQQLGSTGCLQQGRQLGGQERLATDSLRSSKPGHKWSADQVAIQNPQSRLRMVNPNG